MLMKKRGLFICIIAFFLLSILPSCKGGFSFLEYHDGFYFCNESDYRVLLLFDFDASNNEISIDSIPEDYYMIDWCRGHNVAMIDDTSWDKYANDSLHLYILKDAIPLDSVYIKYPQYINKPFITIYEDFITEEYIKVNLMARMTLKLEDIYPTTYSPNNVYFPPKDDSHYLLLRPLTV